TYTTRPAPIHSIDSSPSHFFFLILLPPPTSTLFPYTTLFRSDRVALPDDHRTVRLLGRPAGLDGQPPAGDLDVLGHNCHANTSMCGGGLPRGALRSDSYQLPLRCPQ